MTNDEWPEPFVGLRHYEVDESDIFFGRTTESEELLAVLLSSRLVIVTGPAGSGKSSLVRAGGIAGLGRDAVWLPVGQAVPHSTVAADITPDHNPFTFALLSSWEPDLPARMAGSLTVAQFLETVEVVEDPYGYALPLVAVVDQFEGVFSDVPRWASHRDDFLDQLAEAMARVPRLHLVLVADETVLGPLLRSEAQIARDYRAHYRVAPLDRDAALEAVKNPLTIRRRSFGRGAAEALVDRLRQRAFRDSDGEHSAMVDHVDPASLQVVCTALWRDLPDDVRTITEEHLEAYGDVDTALTELCAGVVTDVASVERIPETDLWTWLDEAFITDLGSRGTAYEGLNTTAGVPHSVAWAFEKRSILHSEKRLGAVWFALQHDLLVDAVRRGRAQAGDDDVASTDERVSDTLLRKAETALAEGMFTLAEEYASRAAAGEDEGPLLAEARSLLGEILLQQAQDSAGERAELLYRQAEDHYEVAMQLFQAQGNSTAVARILAARGQLERLRGHIPEALELLQSALERRRGDPDLYVELARATVGSGQWLAAMGYFNSALVLSADNTDALLGRAALHALRGNARSALADLDSAIRQQPGLALRHDVATARREAVGHLEATA